MEFDGSLPKLESLLRVVGCMDDQPGNQDGKKQHDNCTQDCSDDSQDITRFYDALSYLGSFARGTDPGNNS